MSIDKRNGSAEENGQNIPLPDEPTMRLHCLACEPQHTCNRKKIDDKLSKVLVMSCHGKEKKEVAENTL